MALTEPIERRVGVLTGWRCWFVLPDEGLLRPIYMRGLIWKPRQPFEAACPEQIHAVPSDGCKCGIWAVCHPMLLEEVQWTRVPPKGVERLPGVLVVGQVALWGSIIEHERGWRGQFAYPTQLYALSNNETLAQTLRERYLVPVVWGSETVILEQILPPPLRNLREARADSATAKRRALSEVLTVPCTLPGIVDLIHAQERKALERARERVELAREGLRLQHQQLAAERQALDLERRRDERRLERRASRATAALADLKRRLVEQGIRQSDIADLAHVAREQVCNVLAGRCVSRNVVDAAERLLREKTSAPGGATHRARARRPGDPGAAKAETPGPAPAAPEVT